MGRSRRWPQLACLLGGHLCIRRKGFLNGTYFRVAEALNAAAMMFVALLGSVFSRPLIPDSTPFTQSPFILTHDAGSGYLPGGLVNGWTKTQSQGLAGQLECGARAFDARPLNDPDKGLIWHHGGVAVDYSFNQSIADIKAWCARNPDELVLMTVWDCEGKGCMEAVGAVAIAQNVSNVQDCRAIQTTYGQAKAMGKLRTGGSFLIITGPPTANAVACAITKYDSSLACNCRCWATDETAPRISPRVTRNPQPDSVRTGRPRSRARDWGWKDSRGMAETLRESRSRRKVPSRNCFRNGRCSTEDGLAHERAD